MIASLLNLLDRYRWTTLGVALLALTASAVFLTRLQILDSPERWMPETTRKAWDTFEQHFDAGDTIGIGLHFRRPVTDDDLVRLRRLREQLEAVEGIRQVYDCSLVAEKIERATLTEFIDPANSDRYALYQGVLFDVPRPGDPTRTLMTACELVFKPGEDKTDPDGLNARRRRVVAAVSEIVAEHRADPAWGDVDFHVASGIMMMREMEKRTRQVAYRFLPISIVIGLFSLLVSFRSIRAVLVAIAGSAVAMLLVLGWLGSGGGTLGVVTMAAPTLMAVVGIASTIHFASYAAEQGSTGVPGYRRQFIHWVAVPCCGAAATTGVGFLMLRFNELAPIRDLGTQMFAGSLLAFFGVFLVSQLLPIRGSYDGHWLTPPRLGAFARSTTTQPRLLVLLSAVLLAALSFFAWPRPKDEPFGLHVDADPFSFFSDDQPIKVALDHFAERRFAVYQLDVILIPKQKGKPAVGLEPADRQYLANESAAREFIRRVGGREDLGVIRVLSTLGFRERYEMFLAELDEAREKHGMLAAFLQLGGRANSANILNGTFAAWNIDKLDRGALRLTVVAHDNARGFRPLVDFVRENLPAKRFDCHLAGSVAQTVDLAEGLGQGILRGLGTSLLIMGLLCGLLFRSARLALIAFVPNVFPVLTVFGLMGMFKIPISSGSAMVATIALGIALNDTIHFLLHYRQRTRGEGMPVGEAVNETVQSVGRPIVLTSLVHVAGFAIFLLTDFLPLRHFGLLSSVAMLAALLGDLVLLPNLLLFFDRSPSRAADAEQEQDRQLATT